jgi:hypothetical protein
MSEGYIKLLWEGLTEYQRNSVCEYQKMSEGYIKLLWEGLTKYQRNLICVYQKMSEGYIKLLWGGLTEDQRNLVCKYQKMSEGYIKSNKLTIPWRFDRLTQAERFRLIEQYCKDNNLEYDAKNKTLYAFKTIRNDWYSNFNFSVKYKLNQEARVDMCDCTNSENSFGLSAWTKNKALEYYDKGKLLKVAVKFDDVGFLRKDGKIRCWGLTPVAEVKD